MNNEAAFRAAIWVQLGLLILIRSWFGFRLRRGGERIIPDAVSIRREGWWVFALRFLCFILLVLLLVLSLMHRIRWQWCAFQLPSWLRWTGFVLGLASLGLLTWTHLTLGRLWSANLQLHQEHRLITRGPYSRVRHPMYSAILGWVVSLVLLTANWVAVVLAVAGAIILIARVPREEKMMQERFGEEYLSYMKRTGGFFPVLRAWSCGIDDRFHGYRRIKRP